MTEDALDELGKVETNVGHWVLGQSERKRYQFVIEIASIYLVHYPLDQKEGLDALSEFFVDMEFTSFGLQSVLEPVLVKGPSCSIFILERQKELGGFFSDLEN